MGGFDMSRVTRTEGSLPQVKLGETFRTALKRLSDDRLEKMLSGMQKLSCNGSTPEVRAIGRESFHAIMGIQQLRKMGSGSLGRA